MGPRPPDFDEDLVRQAPTFQRWAALAPGEKLRYACRDFVKGHGDDEERLMRRIMIARRNNLRDHAILKKARKQKAKKNTSEEDDSVEEPPSKKKRSAPSYALTDEEVMREMDVEAVEATRSFQTWLSLEDGQTFTYNQTYKKGADGHEWLLKKNIWRRMRYRRENKKMVAQLKGDPKDELPLPLDMKVESVSEEVDPTAYSSATATAASVATHIVDHTLSPSLLAATDVPPPSLDFVNADVGALSDSGHDNSMHLDVVEAAVAASESYVKQARESDTVDLAVVVAQAALDPPVEPTHLSVHNPIMALTASVDTDAIGATIGDHHTPNPLVSFDGDALDVAAKLAAAASASATHDDADDEYAAV